MRGMWTRRMTMIGGQTAPDDWTILRRGQVVGRVHRGRLVNGAIRIHWSTMLYPCDRGWCDTVEGAQEQLRAAIRARWPDEVGPLPMAGTR